MKPEAKNGFYIFSGSLSTYIISSILPVGLWNLKIYHLTFYRKTLPGPHSRRLCSQQLSEQLFTSNSEFSLSFGHFLFVWPPFSLLVDANDFIDIPHFTALREGYIFYSLKLRSSTSKKITTGFIVILALSWWSATTLVISLRYAYIYHNVNLVIKLSIRYSYKISINVLSRIKVKPIMNASRLVETK